MSDFIVVGGGLLGMLVARELAGAGARITVVERGEPGREASWAGGGILSPLYPWRYPAAVTALAAWSQRVFPALAETLRAESGVDPEWTRSGLLLLEADERGPAKAWAARWSAHVQILSAPVAAEMEPALASLTHAALWMPEVAQVRNPRLLRALRASLERRGVQVESDAEVTDFITQGDTVSGVRSTRGDFRAGGVVVAGGAWSGRLLEKLGIPLAVTPVRGQMLLFRAPPGLVRHMVLAQGHYLVPRRDGRVLAGSTVEYVGFDKSTTKAAYAELRAAAIALVPALESAPIERHWAGLRPGSQSGVPTIGPHPRWRGLYVNAGHFRNGVVLGPASARLLADLILARPPCVDPTPYALPVET